MRLINCVSLILEDFLENPPPYAILSHRWLDTSDEPTYQMMEARTASVRKGFEKIASASHQALREGLVYLWVDTVCIDKTNHVELSTSINSMYRYYERAKICYAYLNDVLTLSDFGKSAWFTRGWTLQELLAPTNVVFYSKDWAPLGTKSDKNMFRHLEEGSGISSYSVFESFHPATYTIAERMSWASKRTTARIEDQAYCLLGLFGVSMPLLYGEGMKAFARLQEQIMQSSTDHSIFAWTDNTVTHGSYCSLLAWSPQLFAQYASVGRESPGHRDYSRMMAEMRRVPWKASNLDWTEDDPVPWFQTNLGIQISLPLVPYEDLPNTFYALLGYGKTENRLAILVTRLSTNRYVRLYGDIRPSADAYQSALQKYGYQIERMFFPEMVPLPRAIFVLFGVSVNHSQMIDAGFEVRGLKNSVEFQQDVLLIRPRNSIRVSYAHERFLRGVFLELHLHRQDEKVALKSLYSIDSLPRSFGDSILARGAASVLAIQSNDMGIGEMLVITACIIEETPWQYGPQYSIFMQLTYCNLTRSLPHQIVVEPIRELRRSWKLLMAVVFAREVLWRPLFGKYTRLEEITFVVAMLLPWIKALRHADQVGSKRTWDELRCWLILVFAERSRKHIDDYGEPSPEAKYLSELQEDVD
ncbi:hypothetical protein SLS60_002823 [Paraconiothyrium brasiliense]|uniref:Heterokaryon incompatibility domain-containing protein n=1 Tax=Paraconiothyrium brasiliense TaxID=300254 RepID=A0ABR3RTY8_9PLEO